LPSRDAPFPINIANHTLARDVCCGANDGLRPHLAAHSHPNRMINKYADCSDLKFRSGIRINPLRGGYKSSAPVLLLRGSPTGGIRDSPSRRGERAWRESEKHVFGAQRMKVETLNWFSGWPATPDRMEYKLPAKRSPGGAAAVAVVT